MSGNQTPVKQIFNNPYNDPNQSRLINTAQQTPQTNFQNLQNQPQLQSDKKLQELPPLQPQPCLFHPHQNITNFCRCQQLMPLCPECISTHLQNHQNNGEFAKIESIDQTAKECFQLINDVSKNYSQDLQKIEEFKNKKLNMNSFMINKLQQARQKVTQIVDTFFDQLQQDFEGYLGNEGETNLGEVQTAEVFIQQKYNEIESLKNKLSSEKYLKYLVRILSTDFQGENLHYHKECEQFLDILQKKTIDLDMDNSKLYTFNMELAKFITIKNADLYQNNQQSQKPTIENNLLQPNSFQNTQPKMYEQKNVYKNIFQNPNTQNQQTLNTHNIHNNNNQSYQNTDRNPVILQDLQGKEKYQQQFHEDAIYQEGFKPVNVKQKDNEQSPPIRDIQKKDPFSKPINIATSSQVQNNISNQKVNFKDYFENRCNDKIMHCFVEENQNFAFQEINKILQNKIQSGKDIDWEFIQLDIQSKLILEGHRSIITPNGHIFLTGGYSNSGESSDMVYQLNPETRQLEQLRPMNKGRSEHGLVYLNNCIYALGGKTSLGTKILDSCERLDLQGGKGQQWKEIHSLRGGVYDFGFCTFKNKYILVFGKNNLNQNIIQCYDPKFDTWNTLEYELMDNSIQFNIKSKVGAIQINDNSIMLFGGIISSEQQESNYLLTLIPQSIGQQMKFKVGPCKDSQQFQNFSYSMDSQIFIHNNQVVSTALVQKNQSITREVITYDGDRWKH